MFVLYLETSGSNQIVGQICCRVFDQIFDQGLGEGKNHKYSLQFFRASRKNNRKLKKNFEKAKNNLIIVFLTFSLLLASFINRGGITWS